MDSAWWTAFGGIATAAGSIAAAVGLILALASLRYTSLQLKQARAEATEANRQAQNTLFLTTTGILFEYYNAKISSLNVAVGAGRNVPENQQKLEELKEKHKALLTEFEWRYRELLESGVMPNRAQ